MTEKRNTCVIPAEAGIHNRSARFLLKAGMTEKRGFEFLNITKHFQENAMKKTHDLSFDEFDEHHFPREEETDFDRVLEVAWSRRHFMERSVFWGTAAFVWGAGGFLPKKVHAQETSRLLNFEAIAANTQDTITVPKGFSWHVVASWGEPLWTKGPWFNHSTRGTGASQELSVGDNNDGMALFVKNGHSILAVNNEYVNLKIIYGNRPEGRPQNADDILKGKAGHGLSIFEIEQKNKQWHIVKNSPFNRRITADSPMEITGPARGHVWMQTAADPSGTHSLGTWNNCGNGKTPWGTYLACEENFNGYFSSSDPDFKTTPAMQRYGVGLKDWGYDWAAFDERFDISKNPNEPNRAGYIVEVDPTNPASTPKKRTALGRLKHENAAVVIAKNGHVVVYTGDDERGEFLYRFVSKAPYVEGGNNQNLLENGTLFVAKFDSAGQGKWLELTPETTGMPEAEICIHTRLAASKVGATTMDRPEWVAVNPIIAEAYCTLTNNKNRGMKPNKGGDSTPVGGPNPRKQNHYGQIVRWVPNEGDHAAAGFQWDLFVIAGNPTVHQDEYAGSSNIHANNMFNSPDGLAFDTQGGLWIQTDGNYSNKGNFAGQGNNQMLLGDTATGAIKRFMVGPKGCEITGITWSADGKTMFVGIQHPGEKGDSHFPGGGRSVPRSSIVAITKNDGSLIG